MSNSKLFGELRSILQRSSQEAAWTELTSFVQSRWAELTDQDWLYLRESLKRWPAARCAMPAHWISQLFDEQARPYLQLARSLSWLDQDIEPEHVDELTECRWLTSLERLEIARSQRVYSARYNLTNDGAIEIAKSPYLRQLKHLNLSGHHLNHESLDYIATRLTSLEHLDLSLNNFDFLRPFSPVAWELERLESLRLRDTKLTLQGLSYLKLQLMGHQRLRALDLGGHPLGVEGADTLFDELALGQLSELGLGGWQLGAGLSYVLEQLQGPLERLDLSDNMLNASAIKALLSWHGARALLHLDLSKNAALGPSLGALLEQLPATLRSLSLGACALNEAALEALSHVELPALEQLDLSQSPSMAGLWATCLKRFGLPAGLKRLDLYGVGLNDEAILALASSKQLDQLEQLKIGDDRISLEALAQLLESPYLKRLKQVDASRLGLSQRQAESLERRFATLRYTFAPGEEWGIQWGDYPDRELDEEDEDEDDAF